MTALEERRQRAEDYGLCDVADAEETVYAVRTAVRSATRVRITPEIERALYAELAKATPGQHHGHARRGLVAAFEAAGFEVQE